MTEELVARAVKHPKGNQFEDFTVGQVFEHHWGRTLNDGDNSLFSTLTLSYNPHYFNAEYAKANGHPRRCAERQPRLPDRFRPVGRRQQ